MTRRSQALERTTRKTHTPGQMQVPLISAETRRNTQPWICIPPSYTARAIAPIEHSRRTNHENTHGRSFRAEAEHVQAKKGHAVESYFKDKMFTGAPGQAVENLIRDLHICAVQQSLDSIQMALLFINALSDPARQFFLTNCSSDLPFDQITNIMRRHYSSDTRKLQIPSEMDNLDLQSFMHKRQVTDYVSGSTQMVDHINALASQLPASFNDDAHKTRYLRRAVMRQEWAQTQFRASQRRSALSYNS